MTESEGAEPPRMGPLPAAVATPLSSARAAVLAQLAEADGRPLRAQQIAKALGQHVNTTREHLEGLVADRLAEATTEAPRGRGRPATLYRCLPGGPMWPIGRQYAALADVLVEQVLESVDDPSSAAYRAGQRWGSKLLDDVPADLTPNQAVERQLAEVGFAPEPTDEGEWRLVRCPLLASARRHPEVVCNVHRGVVAALFEGLGEPSEVSVFPFSEPGACRIAARPTSTENVAAAAGHAATAAEGPDAAGQPAPEAATGVPGPQAPMAGEPSPQPGSAPPTPAAS